MLLLNEKKMKKSVAVLLVCLFLFSFLPAFADTARGTDQQEHRGENGQSNELPAEKKPNPASPRYLLADHAAMYGSLARLDFSGILLLGGLGAATWLLINNDEGIYRDIKQFQARNNVVDRLSPFLSELCQGWSWAAALSFLGVGWLSGREKTVETGSLALQAMFHSFVVIQLVKHLTGRQRPSWDQGRDEWAGPAGFFKRYEDGQWARYDAFASGHTITIWSLATVIASRYNNSFLIPAICYTLAGLAGLATITEDLHWISDVFIAAVAGYAIGRMVLARHRVRSKAFTISPYFGKRGSIGLSLSLSF